LHVPAFLDGVPDPAAGDQDPAAPGDIQHLVQMVGILGPVQDQQGGLATEGLARRLLRGGLGLDAKGSGDTLQGQVRRGLVVEAVVQDAVGKPCRGLVVRGQYPDGLGGQGGLADAAGSAQGNGLAGAQVV